MCGRFYMSFDDSEVARAVQRKLNEKGLFEYAQGEVFPSQNVVVLRSDQGRMDVDVMKWGFSNQYRTINARCEGIEHKRMFQPYLNQRCVLMANGFYEWQKQGKQKHKIYIQKADQPWIYLAGIYNDKREFVIVTGAAEGEMRQVHERVPILLAHEQVRAFLNHELPFRADSSELIFQESGRQPKLNI